MGCNGLGQTDKQSPYREIRSLRYIAGVAAPGSVCFLLIFFPSIL